MGQRNPSPARPLPLLAVLAVAAAGLLLSTRDWRSGAVVLGAALLLGAGLRLSLPRRQAGALVVRSRVSDAGFLLSVGFAMVLLASTIPDA